MDNNKMINYIVRFYSNVEGVDDYIDVDFKKYINFHRFLVEFEYYGGYKWFIYDCLQENIPFKGETIKGGYSKKFFILLQEKIEKIIQREKK